MWQNSGFHGHGNYQQPPQTFEQIEQSQENYQQAHGGGDGFIPFSPVPPGPEWFSQQLHSDLLPYGAGFGEQASPVEVLPEADVYNTSAFMHNQFIASDGQVSTIIAVQTDIRHALESHGKINQYGLTLFSSSLSYTLAADNEFFPGAFSAISTYTYTIAQ